MTVGAIKCNGIALAVFYPNVEQWKNFLALFIEFYPATGRNRVGHG